VTGLPFATTLLAVADSNAALVTFLLYMVAVFVLAFLANRLLRGRSFVAEYFLGSRSLGVWALALTFAATSASGGSFMGFPSKIYSHGWILALWIASYMVVPICAMGLLGKRLNQVARKSGAITIPDVLRDRFGSPIFGIVAVSLIVFFVSFNLVAQFKSGSEILRTLLQDVSVFQAAAAWLKPKLPQLGFSPTLDPRYLMCLVMFAVVVIAYTTYGGFHAVVWTDVMQGVVMVVGVLIMLPLAIMQVGGLTAGTQELAKMQPPHLVLLRVELEQPPAQSVEVPSPWLLMPGDQERPERLIRINSQLNVAAGQTVAEHVRAVEITTPSEIENQLRRLARQESIENLAALRGQVAAGGVVWLDRVLRERSDWRATVRVTLIRRYRYGAGETGVYVTGPGPVPAALPARPGTLIVTLPDLPATIHVLDRGGEEVARHPARFPQEYLSLNEGRYEVVVDSGETAAYRASCDIRPLGHTTLDVTWSSGVAPAQPIEKPYSDSRGFLPLSLAISFFFMWAISGTGQPGNMVRLMAFNDTITLRRSIMTVAIYYSMIYFSLVIIFCCARVMLPGMDLESDRIMPQMAVTLTTNVGHAWLAGLLVAAPFAAVMSTVDSFLLLASSALVRDIYQRNIDPNVPERRIKWMSYSVTLFVGLAATLGAINPPQFLQDIIVYVGSGLAACFLGPIVFAIYWPRSNQAGCVSGMIAGFAAHLCMYIAGWAINGSFYQPYQLFNFDPIIIGLTVSFAATYLVALATPPPPRDLVHKYFYVARTR
jgi:Na+/proline symporter